MAFPLTTDPVSSWAFQHIELNPPGGWAANLFLEDQPLTFTLENDLAVSYEVRGYWGNVVASGPVSGTSLTLESLQLGWYRLYLRQADPTDPIYGNLIGTQMFSVLK